MLSEKKIKIIAINLIIMFIVQIGMPLTQFLETATTVKAAGEGQVWDYGYTGNVQEFTAPYAGKYYLQTWGASGGHKSGDNYGRGGHSYGYYNLYQGQKLYIYTGQQGSMSSGTSGATFNGGGEGRDGTGSGGGASDIRTVKVTNGTWYNTNHTSFLEDESLNSRLIVAGGAGGNAYGSTDGLSVGKNGNDADSLLTNIPVGEVGRYLYKESSPYSGYIGAGGGGYVGGKQGRRKNYDNWSSAGYGGSGYVGGVYSGATHSGNLNAGNGKASIQYVGQVQSTLTIQTGDNATVNGQKGNVQIQGVVGSTITLPTPVMNAGYYLRNILDQNDNVYSSKNYTYTFENKVLKLEAYADLQLNITMQNGKVYTSWAQKDNVIKAYELYVSADGTNYQNIILDSSNADGANIKTKNIPINKTFTNATSYQVENDGIYYLNLYGQKGGTSNENHPEHGAISDPGANGGRSYGYVRLKKGDTITTAIYSGGGGASSSPKFPIMAGGGGSGIGVLLNGTVIIAAGGGAGRASSCWRTTSDQCQDYGGLNTFSSYSPNNSSTNGSGTWNTNYYLNPGAQAGYGGGYRGGGGGGYPFGGNTSYSGGTYINNSVMYSDAGATTHGGTASYNASGNGSVSAALSGNFVNTYIESDHAILEAKDTLAPNKPSNARVKASTTNDITLEWDGNGDNGNKTYYMTKSYDVSNLNTPLQVSNVATAYVETGVAGYYYYTDNNASGTVSKSHTYVGTNQATISRTGIGNYIHIAAVDRAGNLGATYDYKTNKVDVNGSITWKDEANKYGLRASKVTVELYQNGTKIQSKEVSITGENTNFSFTGLDEYTGTTLNKYTVKQSNVTGYESTYNGYTIGNEIVLPKYKSQIEYTPVDTLNNQYLKNAKVKIQASVGAYDTNQEKVGLHTGVATFVVDSAIQLDSSTLSILLEDGTTGIKTTVTSYTISGNTITVNFGTGSSFVTKAGDMLRINITGTTKEIKAYSNSIKLTGKLTDLRGTNTNVNLGEMTKTQNGITITNQLPEANIRIKKVDSITEQILTDAIFTLYEWNGTSYVQKATITDSNKDGIYESAYYRWNTTTQGKYKIVETQVPTKHTDLGFIMECSINQIKNTTYTIQSDYSNSSYQIRYDVRNPDDFNAVDGTVENEPFKIKAKIKNIDKETRQQIQNNAEYEIYEWDTATNAYKPYTSYITSNKVGMTRQADKSYLSQEWLYYTASNAGKYKIVEKTAATGYYGDYDASSQKRQYEINILTILANGNYQGQTIANEGTILISNNADTTLENVRVKTQFSMNLIDKETKNSKAQASGSLEGAQYEVRAKETILHPDGITAQSGKTQGILYQKDELVTVLQINEEMKAQITTLECGKYYLQERKAPEGYVLDTTKYDLDLTYQGQQTPKIVKQQTFENTIKKQGFQIMKQQNNGRNELSPLKDAGFTIYEIKELSIVKEGKVIRNEDGTYTVKDIDAKYDDRLMKYANPNNTYDIQDIVNYYYKIQYTEDNMQQLPQSEKTYQPYTLTDEPLVKDYSKVTAGEAIRELYSADNGYLKSPELAYGEYIVIETSVPKEKEAAMPFMVTVENDSRELQNLRYILDENFTTRVKIYSIDTQTGKNILKDGSKFVIKNVDTGEFVTHRVEDLLYGYKEYGTRENPFESTRKGFFITPMELPVGKYQLIQVETSKGYILNGYEKGTPPITEEVSIQFQITTNGVYYIDNELDSNVIVQKQRNKSQEGTIEIDIEGEVLKQVAKTQENYQFEYEKRKVEGITIGIYAKENIVSQDNQGTIKYQKDQLVQQIQTNNQGKARAEILDIGKYYIKEIQTANGYAIDTQIREFEIEYGTNNVNLPIGSVEWKKEAQTTPEIHKTAGWEEKRQKIEIEVNNIDIENQTGLVGTKIGLYAKEDIISQVNNQKIVQKDELLKAQYTTAEGKIQFAIDVPLGRYYIKEVDPAQGYTQNVQAIQIDATYREDQRKVIKIQEQYGNEKTSLTVKKINNENQAIQGSILQIQNKEGRLIKEWETGIEAETTRTLETQKEYKIVELRPAQGYVTKEEQIFIINEDGEIQTQAQTEGKSTILLPTERTKLEVELKDKQTQEKIAGVRFQIVTQEGQVIREFETGTNNYTTEGLPIGVYTLKQNQNQVEALLAKGYVTQEDQIIEIQDKKEMQKVTIEQETTKEKIQVKDIVTSQNVVGVKFEIVKADTQAIIREFETTDQDYNTEKLPVGSYIIRPKEQNQSFYQKGYVKIAPVEFTVQETKEVQVTTIQQDVTKIEIELKDGQTQEKIEGVSFEIVTQDNQVVREFTTGTDNYTNQKLPVGNYILRQKANQTQAILQKGYVTQDNTMLQVQETKENQKTTIQQETTKVEIGIKDIVTKEQVAGVAFEIVSKQEGKQEQVIREFETTNENYRTEKLPVGTYTIRPKQEQKEEFYQRGYVKVQEQELRVEETKQTQPYEVKQEITRVEIELKDKQTNQKIEGVKFQILTQQGQVIREFTTGAENYHTEKLPVGTYIVRQEKNQQEAILEDGYVTQEDHMLQVQETKEIQKIIIEQEVTKLAIQVKDVITNEQVEGVKFEIVTKQEGKQEQVVREFETTNQEYYTEKLPVGNYVIRPKEQNTTFYERGYVKVEEVAFVIEETKQIQKLEIQQEVTKLEVELKDKESNQKIEGVKFQILTKEDRKMVREFTTGAENYHTEKLPIGKYILKQEGQQEAVLTGGYVTQDEIGFEIQESKKIQRLQVNQETTKVEISLKDVVTKEQVEGVKFEIVKADTQEIVREYTTGAENYYTEKLPIGNYVIRPKEEQEAPFYEKGYIKIAPVEFAVEESKMIQALQLEQEITRAEIELTDPKTQEKLEGVKFTLVQKEGEEEHIIREFTTGKDNYYTEKLPIGDYLLRQQKDQKEAILEKGYVTQEEIPVQIKETKEVQKVAVEQQSTKLEIEWKDQMTQEAVEGVKLEIIRNIEKQGETGENITQEEVVREFETTKENYYTEKLPVGNYVIRPKQEQKEDFYERGYVRKEEVTFTIQETKDIQTTKVEQEVTKVEIAVKDIKTKENVVGVAFEIFRQQVNKDEIEETMVKEFITGEQNEVITKLPVGNYVIKPKQEQTKEFYEKGYVKVEQVHFKVEESKEVQTVLIEQTITQAQIQIVDKETKEAVIGVTVEIQDKQTGVVKQQWTSEEKAHEIERLPVGEYQLVQKIAPTLKGYVKTDPVDFKIEETKEVQKVEMKQEYTKLEMKIVDEITQEEIKGIELVLKDEKDREVARWKIEQETTEDKTQDKIQELKRLPVGKYKLQTVGEVYGYQALQKVVEIRDRQGIQTNTFELKREAFDFEIKQWVNKVIRNEQEEQKNTKQEGPNIIKIDIKDKKIGTEQVKVVYKIQVKNVGKIIGQVGKIEVNIPSGMRFEASDNQAYWKQEANKVIATGLAERNINPKGEAQIELILRWKNGLENFGTKTTIAKLQEVKSNNGYEESNKANNEAKVEVIMGVGTGEVNLIWACIILLWVLVPIEMIIHRRLKMKKFALKDKTIQKYKKQ